MRIDGTVVRHESGVYLIRNMFNGKVYVGSSVDMYERGMTHVRMLRSGKHPNDHLKAAWNKYGPDVLEFMVVERCLEDVLIPREEAWVGYYDSMNDEKGYNLRSPDRKRVSEETRRKISQSRVASPKCRGRKCPMDEVTKLKISRSRIGNPKCLGHGKSEELKKQLSELHVGNQYRLGHKDSEETRRKKSEAHQGLLKGGHLSEEHRKKLSIAHQGKIPWNKGRRHTEASIQRMKDAHRSRCERGLKEEV